MKIVVFTGAGLSRESGLQTFRDSDGLWEGHRVEDVCTVDAWRRQPQVVLDFYNQRRREVQAAVPNAAHRAIADLAASGHSMTVVTQNIDDLHERAGVERVLHVHGLITEMRTNNDDTLVPCPGDIALGDIDAHGSQYRPHVVFFGEGIYHMDEAISATIVADVLLVVGSTLQVYPAAYVAEETGAQDIWIVDPVRPDNERILSRLSRRRLRHIAKPASEGVPEAVAAILAPFR